LRLQTAAAQVFYNFHIRQNITYLPATIGFSAESAFIFNQFIDVLSRIIGHFQMEAIVL